MKAWGELYPTLEDVLVLIDLPLFGDVRTIKLSYDVEEIALDEEGKRKLEPVNKGLCSKTSNKSSILHGRDILLMVRDDREQYEARGHALILALVVRVTQRPWRWL